MTTDAGDGGAAEEGWQRLDPRMLAVTPLRQLFGFLPVIAVVLVVGGGRDLDGRFYALVAGVLAVVVAGVLRWVTTRYRITGERVELRSGLVFRSARSVPRDRIRSVDLTAGPVHRVFGLSVVKIGTGEHVGNIESRELTLDAVSAAEADQLRQRLLNRLEGADRDSADLPDNAAPGGAGTTLAVLDWSWLRFAPLTVSSLAAVAGVVGAFTQFVGEIGLGPSRIAELSGVSAEFDAAPLWLGLSIFALVVLGIAVIGALLIFTEAWWGFRLVREPGGTLRISRGLLTTRSVSLEERRLRGVEVGEPLLMRLGRGARLTAVATGLGGASGTGRSALLPPAPLDQARRVASLILADDQFPVDAQLRKHPTAALRRRLVRAVLPVLLVATVLFLLPVLRVASPPGWVGWATLGLLPLTVLLAQDAYRNLGHILTEQYLVTRHGAGMRRTVTLQRSGVIGWTVSQSLFQRRAGLVTLTATTAAGSGAYHVFDVGIADGLAVADEAVPGLLEPFLQRDESALSSRP
ncbi:MAG: PH domain-containing protein [Pseudonocardiaceae bacterium]